jgi:hypothetical protein
MAGTLKLNAATAAIVAQIIFRIIEYLRLAMERERRMQPEVPAASARRRHLAEQAVTEIYGGEDEQFRPSRCAGAARSACPFHALGDSVIFL